MQPNLLNPYGLQNTPLYASLVPQATTSQGPQLLRVKGIESAKLFQTVPNSQVALFDEDEDILYIKTTDASNFPTIRKFKFVEIPDSPPAQQGNYVTMDEFNKFKEELLNGKLNIRSNWSGGRNRNKPSNYSISSSSEEQPES